MLLHKLGVNLDKCTLYQVRTTEEVSDYHLLSAKEIQKDPLCFLSISWYLRKVNLWRISPLESASAQ